MNEEDLERLRRAIVDGDEIQARSLLRAEDLSLPEASDTLNFAGHLALRSNQPGILKFLVSLGLDLSAPLVSDLTPLHVAAGLSLWSGEMTKALLDLGARPFGFPEGALHPLLITAKNGNVDAGRHLLEAGADVNVAEMHFTLQRINQQIQRVEGVRGAIHLAVEEDHPEFIKLLAEFDVDLELRNNKDQTPLLMAAEYGHMECLSALLEAGSNVEATAHGYGIRKIALENNHPGVLALLEYHQLGKATRDGGVDHVGTAATRRRL